MIPRQYFKSQTAYERQIYLCPEAREVLKYSVFTAFPKANIINPIITETVTTLAEDLSVKRKHDQHRKRVAFDVRVKDWAGEQIDAVKADLDEQFKHYAYETDSGVKQIAYCHGDGDNIHFHCAVNARYKKQEFKP